MTEPLDLDAIKARLDAATPGPWVWDWDDATTDLAGELSTADGPGVIDHVYDTIYIRPNDRTLIAHAPTDIAALVAEVERLRAEHWRLVRRVRDMCRVADGLMDKLGLQSVMVPRKGGTINYRRSA